MAINALLKGLKAFLFPQPIHRNAEQQAEVDRQTQSLALYEYTSCPYCARVRRAIRQLALNIELRNVHRQPEYRDELVEHGGRFQVPCLRIEEAGKVRWLYESADIITYLRQRFGSA